MRVTLVTRVRQFRQRESFARDLFFRTLHPLCYVLDYVPVVIARAERHRCIVATRILAEQLFGCALRLDEIFPVETRNRAQAADTVSNRDLSERDTAV